MKSQIEMEIEYRLKIEEMTIDINLLNKVINHLLSRRKEILDRISNKYLQVSKYFEDKKYQNPMVYPNVPSSFLSYFNFPVSAETNPTIEIPQLNVPRVNVIKLKSVISDFEVYLDNLEFEAEKAIIKMDQDLEDRLTEQRRAVQELKNILNKYIPIVSATP